MWTWELYLGPLQKKQVLLPAEPSPPLQPPHLSSFFPFLNVCMSVLPVCMTAHPVHAWCLQHSEEGVRASGISYTQLLATMWIQGIESMFSKR